VGGGGLIKDLEHPHPRSTKTEKGGGGKDKFWKPCGGLKGGGESLGNPKLVPVHPIEPKKRSSRGKTRKNAL